MTTQVGQLLNKFEGKEDPLKWVFEELKSSETFLEIIEKDENKDIAEWILENLSEDSTETLKKNGLDIKNSSQLEKFVDELLDYFN